MADWHDPERRRLPGLDFGLSLVLESLMEGAAWLFAATIGRLFD